MKHIKPGDMLKVKDGVAINMWHMQTRTWLYFIRPHERMLVITHIEREPNYTEGRVVVLVNGMFGYVSDGMVAKAF